MALHMSSDEIRALETPVELFNPVCASFFFCNFSLNEIRHCGLVGSVPLGTEQVVSSIPGSVGYISHSAQESTH